MPAQVALKDRGEAAEEEGADRGSATSTAPNLEAAVALVLVVNDDPAIAGLIEFHLRRGGHQAMVFVAPAPALAAMAGPPRPDMAVLDVSLPGMTGFELLEALRALDGLAGLGAVFLSPRTRPKDADTGTLMGATYLTKPLVGAALLAAVTGIVAGSGTDRPEPSSGRPQASLVNSTTTSRAWADPPL